MVCGTPNLLPAGQATRVPIDYVGAGVATSVRDVAEVRAALLDPQRPDRAARRAFLDDHFRSGDATGRIIETVGRALGVSPPGVPSPEGQV